RRLVFAAAVGEQGKRLLGREFDASLGIAGHVLRTGRPDNVADVRQNPDFFEGIDEQSDFTTRGLIAAPMIFQEEKLGVVEVLNPLDREQFDENDLKLLGIFANLAASAARNAKAHDILRKENLALRGTVLGGVEVVGRSRAVQEMLRLADRVAPTHSTVLLLGETGTGKEVLAKYIHRQSPRRDKPFIAVNCAALPETLLESELFGHEKGAFTGAVSQHIGRFELADQGTLLLDEIGDLSASIQVKLLRLIQEKTFNRIGGTRTITSNVRIIAATNRDLQEAITEGTFREDLYYRLNVFPIRLAPLRERREDIPLLIDHFVRQASAELGLPLRKPSPEVVQLLTAYDWPGNIRELANVLERAVLLTESEIILPQHLPPEIKQGGREPRKGVRGLRESERAMIVQALKDTGWNQTQAARLLGISRDNLRYRLKKYNITRKDTE
ncbi:MAG: sigma-54-dependent Fis family transcriptional regulator, partial [Planctomycetota bacterium]